MKLNLDRMCLRTRKYQDFSEQKPRGRQPLGFKESTAENHNKATSLGGLMFVFSALANRLRFIVIFHLRSLPRRLMSSFKNAINIASHDLHD